MFEYICQLFRRFVNNFDCDVYNYNLYEDYDILDNSEVDFDEYIYTLCCIRNNFCRCWE